MLKGTVVQTEKALTNDRLRVSKVSQKCRIPAYFLTAFVVFSDYKQNLMAQ